MVERVVTCDRVVPFDQTTNVIPRLVCFGCHNRKNNHGTLSIAEMP